MKFGICLPHYGREIQMSHLLEMTREAERLGFDSIWVTDHLIVPNDVEIIYREYMLEPIVMLSHLAAVTSSMTLGTSVIILPYRNPIIVAKMLATIDILSSGRLIFGAAAGWMEGEFAALEVPFQERGELSDEYLQIIREIWTHEHPQFQGKYFKLEEITTSPMPVQKPRPPIWIGGNSKRAMRRAVELGDVWHPVGLAPDQIKEGRAYMERLSRRRNLDRVPGQSLRIGLSIEGVSVPAGPYASRTGRTTLRGSLSEVKEKLAGYNEVGMEHIVLDMSTLSHESFLKTMETFVTKIM
ncbi:MAG: TIGR03619 family F420-dependent LLM class oxidoreductase [Candidatus Tectomicrobia bacterium]|nr:TIGR03619 family F420-dependent LLM class oxidoreductase [Candidatus Tectomicrobia bacterium]